MGQLCRVIARSPAGAKDLGIRAHQDHRRGRRAQRGDEAKGGGLSATEALWLLRDYSEFNHVLGNYTGLLAEKLGRFLNIFGHRPSSYRRLAAVIIVWLLMKHPERGMKIRAEMIRRRERVGFDDTASIDCLIHCPLIR